MDVGLIDENMEHYVGAVEVDSLPNEGGEVDGSEDPTEKELPTQDANGNEEPHVGMEFKSGDAAKTFYDEYAKRVGFSTRVNQSSRCKPDGTISELEFICGREALKRKNGEKCNAIFKVERQDLDKWVVTKFVKEHSHSTITPNKVHYLRPRKQFSGARKTMDQSYNDMDFSSNDDMDPSIDGNHIPIEISCVNRPVKNFMSASSARHSNRNRHLGDAQNLLDYFKKMQAEHPGFYYAVQLDDNNCMTNVFWADARSRTAYSHFGDVVNFDTTYRLNHYRVPFAPFTGVNHHGQMVLFGCALLADESESSFIWLFKTWLAAMNDQPPVSITTDQDKVVRSAVSKVFPGTRHRLCKWHILREGQKRLAHVCSAHPMLQGDLYNSINLTETIEEFESSWSSIIDRYNLSKNDWLQVLYNARTQWVPVYFRDSFFAAISSNQGGEAAGSFFDGYVDQHTTLPLFFRQYEKALEHCFAKEIEADFDTFGTTPVLKTPSPMEKQAANLYTRKIFSKFQEELVETFAYTANTIESDGAVSTFRVAKFDDQQKVYMVTLNVPEIIASCNCQMFEYSGILCRHVLTVFTVTNVLTLPSHYILKRWTRNAKVGVGSYDQGPELETPKSVTSRYNTICREAIKYAEEGAITAETYDVAMGAIREMGKKIAVMKKNVARVTPGGPRVSGSQEDSNKLPSSSASNLIPLLWPQQEEAKFKPLWNSSDTAPTVRLHQATRHTNTNDTGSLAPPADQLPLMAPVSFQHDDALPDNMVVLPYLKSMTWVMENKNSRPAKRLAVINLKLQDYSKAPLGETEVKFQLSKVTLEPMLRSMADIGEQLATPDSRVAVINLKLQDTETTSGEAEVKFQVSKDTLGAMLRSMAYIREQLSNPVQRQQGQPSKKQRL